MRSVTPASAADSTPTAPERAPATTPPPPAAPPVTNGALPPIRAAALPPLPTNAPPTPPAAGAAIPGALPKFRLPDEPITAKRRGKTPSEPIPEINVAGAIEEYLQYKLRQTPEYAGRALHVRPAPDGGVRIQVDARFYEAVGDVDDPVIREFLTRTIQEWQDQQ